MIETNYLLIFFPLQLQETLEKLDIQLSLELWYTEHGNGLATAGILPSTPTSNNGGNIQTSNSQNSSAGDFTKKKTPKTCIFTEFFFLL